MSQTPNSILIADSLPHVDSTYFLTALTPPRDDPTYESEPYHELYLQSFNPPLKIDFDTVKPNTRKTCLLNIFNPNDLTIALSIDDPIAEELELTILRKPPLPIELIQTIQNDDDDCPYHVDMYLSANESLLIRITFAPTEPVSFYTSLAIKWASRYFILFDYTYFIGSIV